jgi:mono/diheme cytochrome c family protein
MPPFRQILDDREIAAVLTYIRQAWGNAAPPVSELDVMQNQ